MLKKKEKENGSFIDHAFGIWLPDDFKLVTNWKKDNGVTICRYEVIYKFFDVFFLSSLVIGQSFMSISWLVLELRQFSFLEHWSEIRKSEIPSSEFCSIPGDWSELGIPNVARMSLIRMLLNAAKCQCYKPLIYKWV